MRSTIVIVAEVLDIESQVVVNSYHWAVVDGAEKIPIVSLLIENSNCAGLFPVQLLTQAEKM